MDNNQVANSDDDKVVIYMCVGMVGKVGDRR
jgi:hypothetical protein